MSVVCWAAYNPRRALPILALLAMPACVLVARRVVGR